jgi:hypothetical protein
MSDERKTFEVPDGHVAESDSEGRATGKVRRKSLTELAMELEEAQNRLRDSDGDKGVWRHKGRGTRYTQIDVSLREADMVILVNYCPEFYFRVQFSRPISEWLEKYEFVKADGQ